MLTVGIIIGLLSGLTSFILDYGFNWGLIKKIAICFTLLGVIMEIASLRLRNSKEAKMHAEIEAIKKKVKKEIDETYR
jgi:hypothetical protein